MEKRFRKKNDKRQAILKAALELLAEQGFHGAPASLIAERAGVGVGTIYRYFKNKDDLIHQLFHDIYERTLPSIVADYDSELPPRERFIFLFTGVLRFFIRNPRDFKFMEQYHYSPHCCTCYDSMEESQAPIRHLLTQARAQGIIKDAPMEVLESLAFGPLVALAKEGLNGRLRIDDAMMRLIVESCWDSLQR